MCCASSASAARTRSPRPSVQLNIAYLKLDDTFKLEPEEAALVPESVARRFCLIPLKRSAGPTVTVVLRDPLDIEAVDTVRSLTKLEVHKAVSTADRIMAVIDKYYRAEAHIERDLQNIVDGEVDEQIAPVDGEGAEAPVDSEQLRVLANDVPVVRFVNLMLMQAVRDRASDIHFEPGEHTVNVRLRVDGVLHEVTPPPKAIYAAIVTRIKILAGMDIAERRLPLDGRFKFRISGRLIDFRVSSMPEIHGEKIVLRVLDRDSLLLDLKAIGFDDGMRERFDRVLHMPNGIILLTGPTGSGKTSTLYSALRLLRSPERNIQTVEDPVEYQLEGINQMQIRPAVGLNFADALRSILRQDPDVIMIGEIRDEETARIAMRASLTGHLVLSTLHTNDAPSAFWRLRDIGIQPYLIAATVKLVIAQRLLRRNCIACRTETVLSEELMEVVEHACPDARSWTFIRGAGCEDCSRTGFRGRVAVLEFLETRNWLRDMLLGDTGEVAFRAKAFEMGLEPLHVNGFRKVQQGLTTVEEVLNVCPLPDTI
jgi:type IV pilus assembly protein PilB